MKKFDIVIVGAGLIGSVVAEFFKKNNKSVCLIDNNEFYSASKCALGVFKDSWGAKIKPIFKDTMKVLQELYGVDVLTFFNLDKEVKEDMKGVEINKILHANRNILNDKVVKVRNNIVFLENNKPIKGAVVLLSTGVWVDNILEASKYDKLGVKKYWGANMEIALPIEENRIQTWAPFKQSICLKTNYGFMFSDSASVKEPKKDDKRLKKVSERSQRNLNEITFTNIQNQHIKKVREGYRPFLPKGVDYFNQHDDNLFSATGGAKNTLLITGHVALKTYEAFCLVSQE